MEIAELLQRYNLPIPRYTSYPTVPQWNDWSTEREVTPQGGASELLRWEAAVRQTFRIQNRPEGISVYIHLPYCESLCTYCGCNKKITTNHEVEQPYIDAVLREWAMYVQLFPEAPLLRELHLGGGTPTFFSSANLACLIEGILAPSALHPDFEFGFEGHPNNTTYEQLRTLHEHGFRRVSFGVQDLDPEVQLIINRIQPFENLKQVTEWSRELGYSSVNFDLIYGLPRQNEARLQRTIQQALSLKPDRIAFYSYAHIPWKSKAQRLYSELDLPDTATKMQLYLNGRQQLLTAGYTDIGMDHFALQNDALALAAAQNRLHRNFMGYTTTQSRLLIGLGVSSISDAAIAYAQNTRELSTYLRKTEANEWPLDKGCFLQRDDQINRRHILDLSCQGRTVLENDYEFGPQAMQVLKQMQNDGLVTFDGQQLEATAKGRLFTRNICSLFDQHLLRTGNRENQYSKSI